MSNVQETNPAFSRKDWCRKHGPLYPDDPPPKSWLYHERGAQFLPSDPPLVPGLQLLCIYASLFCAYEAPLACSRARWDVFCSLGTVPRLSEEAWIKFRTFRRS